jgi:DNA recombination protein RmuC
MNVAVSPDRHERVEFAIKLPGREGEEAPVYLPIDAKFPQDDYQRLQDAYERADSEAVEVWRQALRRRLIDEADTIRSKYLDPPHTTDFAIMFLPTEGLYAEVLRMPGLCEELQATYHVVPTGPTTLWALLNSLQMGFRTLAIEKRSSEVWKVLGAVKTEFSRFGDSLDAVGKKLEEASNKISDTSRRSRAMQRKLREVEGLPEPQAVALLAGVPDDSDEPEA